MSALQHPIRRSEHRWPMFLGLVALIALLLSVYNSVQLGRNQSTAGLADKTNRWNRICEAQTLRVGYGGWPPYTIINLNESNSAKRVTGFSVDLVNEIASRFDPPLKVEWRQFAWDALKAEFASDQFDFVADPVFQTIPRASDFAFSLPYSYFGIAVALVRKDESRFEKFSDLDQEGITIALAEGWTSSEYAKANLSKPKFKSIPVTGDAFTQLDEVLAGRADLALNDVPTILQYVRAHKSTVKALWLDNPPSQVAGAFMMRSEDTELRKFLDSAVTMMIADGTLQRLDRKWKTLGFLPGLKLIPGLGLQEPSTTSSQAKEKE